MLIRFESEASKSTSTIKLETQLFFYNPITFYNKNIFQSFGHSQQIFVTLAFDFKLNGS